MPQRDRIALYLPSSESIHEAEDLRNQQQFDRAISLVKPVRWIASSDLSRIVADQSFAGRYLASRRLYTVISTSQVRLQSKPEQAADALENAHIASTQYFNNPEFWNIAQSSVIDPVHPERHVVLGPENLRDHARLLLLFGQFSGNTAFVERAVEYLDIAIAMMQAVTIDDETTLPLLIYERARALYHSADDSTRAEKFQELDEAYGAVYWRSLKPLRGNPNIERAATVAAWMYIDATEQESWNIRHRIRQNFRRAVANESDSPLIHILDREIQKYNKQHEQNNSWQEYYATKPELQTKFAQILEQNASHVQFIRRQLRLEETH